MHTKIRRQLRRRKQHIERRLNRANGHGCRQPMFAASKSHDEIADRVGPNQGARLKVFTIGSRRAVWTNREGRNSINPYTLPVAFHSPPWSLPAS